MKDPNEQPAETTLTLTLVVPEGTTEADLRNAIAQGARTILPLLPKDKASRPLYMALNNAFPH